MNSSRCNPQREKIEALPDTTKNTDQDPPDTSPTVQMALLQVITNFVYSSDQIKF